MKINRLLFAMMLLCAAYVCSSCTEDEDYTQGVWDRKSDLDGVARSQASSFTIGNKGYICCGYRGSGKLYLKDLWVYDIEGNYWTQCASMPEEASIRKDAAAFALNGKGYITTGAIKEEPNYLSDTWEYDPATDSWMRKDDFTGGMRYGAIAFSVANYGYVGTGYNDNWLKDFYRFDPNAPSGKQWEVVNGFGGQKRKYASAFVINNEAYICCGENNGGLVEDFWKFDGTKWTQLRDIANTNDDEDYDDDYAITRYSAVSFVIDNKGYITSGKRGSNSLSSDYWVYHPETDVWTGDADDDYTPFEGTARSEAVAFSTGTRGFILTGASSGYFFDDMWELLPYKFEEVD